MKIPDFIVRILSTFFYVGFLPFIPGTFGSLAGVGVYYLIKDNVLFYGLALLIAVLAGFGIAGRAEEIFKKKDPRYFVLDEVAGMLISLAFLPYDIKIVITGFLVFRFFDAVKPYPIGSLERLKGGWGIMADDLMAGIYSNIVLQLVFKVTAFKGS